MNEIKGNYIIGGTLFHFARKADANKMLNKARRHGILLQEVAKNTLQIYNFQGLKEDHKERVLNQCKRAFEESLR